MFIKIIISLGFIFLVDSAVGKCGRCQTNHVACHSEDTFSLCAEGKSTDYVVRCPKNKVCTNDQAICVEKDNDGLIAPSCMTGKLPMEIGSFYETQDVVKTQDSTAAVVLDEEIATTDNPSTSEPEEGGISLATQYSDATSVDSTVIGVSDGIISTTTDEIFTKDQEDKDSSTIEELNTSTYTSVTDEELTSVTEDTSTTEPAELSSSSTQDISSGDISTTDTSISDISTTDVSISDISTTDVSTTDIETSSSASSSAPRDATTFCSENKDIGTFKAEGDTTCKRYYICTTYKDGLKGYEFNCGEENYFNSETSLCQKEKPDDC